MNKRNEYVTVMLTSDMKIKIQEIAKENMWTISQTVYVMLRDYFASMGWITQDDSNSI